MNYCGQCGAPLGAGTTYCGRCGATIPTTGAATTSNTIPSLTNAPTSAPAQPRSNSGIAARIGLGGLGLLLLIALVAIVAHPNSAAPNTSAATEASAPVRPTAAARSVPPAHPPTRVVPAAIATTDHSQGDDAAPVAHDANLPAGATSSGCMVGTRGHSIVMVYSEDARLLTSACRHVSKGEYLYTTAPDLSALTRYCTATKNDSSETLDVYDTRADLAQSGHPKIGPVANAVCAIFQGNNQWMVDRDMSLVPTYTPGDSTAGPIATVDASVGINEANAEATPTDVSSADAGSDGGNSTNDQLASDEGGTGPTAECNDGTTSYSHHPSGTCSHHGGVATWDDHLLHSTP